MTTPRDLKDALQEMLTRSGALAEIKARIRAEIFSALHENSEDPPPLSQENLIINELIKEYLVFNEYRYSESVLIAETGQPEHSLGRDFLEEQLQVKTLKDAESVPLLYSMVSYFSKGKKCSPDAVPLPPHSPPSKLTK